MENASKALLMAGGVLISIIIASMLVLMFNNLNNYQKNSNEQKFQAEILAFNQPYEGYNRKDVRGNDLVSLINRVTDYNRRKTTASDESDDTYKPIKITIDLTDPNTNSLVNLSREDKNQIFTGNIEIGGINSIDTLLVNVYALTGKTIEVDNKNFNYTEQVLDELVTAYDKIFIDDFDSRSIDQKIQIFYNFNNVFGKKVFETNFDNISNDETRLATKLTSLWNILNSEIREDVNLYYEYVQFKRAIFECTNVKYNEDTGKIEQMEFKYTGEIN